MVRVVTPDYFNIIGVPIMRGRGFMPSDQARTVQVVVVSQEFARKHLPETKIHSVNRFSSKFRAIPGRGAKSSALAAM